MKSKIAQVLPPKVVAGTAEDPLIVVSILVRFAIHLAYHVRRHISKFSICLFQQEPFLMLKDSYRKELAVTKTELDLSKITEDHVQGFVVDLLDLISQNMISRGGSGFNYKLYLIPDNQFGILETGNWSGLMREILDGVSSY